MDPVPRQEKGARTAYVREPDPAINTAYALVGGTRMVLELPFEVAPHAIWEVQG